jgi:hypothetical protein
MTLDNMRANGVRSLLVYCFACHHEAVFGVEDYPDDVPVPAFAPRMVCTRCGMIGADARPNWSERHRPTGGCGSSMGSRWGRRRRSSGSSAVSFRSC